MKTLFEYLLGKKNPNLSRVTPDIIDSDTWEIDDVLYGLFDDGWEGLDAHFFKILNIENDVYTLQQYSRKKVSQYEQTMSDNKIGKPMKIKLNKRKNIVVQGEWLRLWDGNPIDV